MNNPFTKFIKYLNFLRSTDFRYYLGLRVRKMMGFKTFRVDHPTVSTKDKTLTIGKEYQLKEGGYIDRIIIENISFINYCLRVKIFLIDQQKRTYIEHTLDYYAYAGMWRICDRDKYDIEY